VIEHDHITLLVVGRQVWPCSAPVQEDSQVFIEWESQK